MSGISAQPDLQIVVQGSRNPATGAAGINNRPGLSAGEVATALPRIQGDRNPKDPKYERPKQQGDARTQEAGILLRKFDTREQEWDIQDQEWDIQEQESDALAQQNSATIQ